MSLWIVLPVVVALIALRLLRVGLLAWVLAWWLALYVTLRYGFEVPVPRSAVALYMAIVTVSLAAYVLSSRERTGAFVDPLVRLIVERRHRLALTLVLLLLPALAAFNVYRKMSVPIEPPFFARTIHPSPPVSITVHGNEIDLIQADNPLRRLAHDDPERYRERVRSGRDIYYRNCFYCHGDGLAGDGMFAHGLNPIPTDFTDAGVLPNFREAFFFWRVAKGGPGMPEEGGPWDSAMPEWERFLSEEEVWEVVLFLYDFTGYPPRAVAEGHGTP